MKRYFRGPQDFTSGRGETLIESETRMPRGSRYGSLVVAVAVAGSELRRSCGSTALRRSSGPCPIASGWRSRTGWGRRRWLVRRGAWRIWRIAGCGWRCAWLSRVGCIGIGVGVVGRTTLLVRPWGGGVGSRILAPRPGTLLSHAGLTLLSHAAAGAATGGGLRCGPRAAE
jgi:hypothetical protein